MARLLVVSLFACAAASSPVRRQSPTALTAAAPKPVLPTPAAKLLDVGVSAASETVILLMGLKMAALAIEQLSEGRSKAIVAQLVWLVVIQGSARVQGLMGINNQVGRPTKVLNPQWYDSLVKPSWNPPAWAFPAVWIPLKLLQVFAANLAWQSLDRRVFALPIVLFVVHLALGDVWNAQFFLKQRPLTGVFVIFTFWGVLLAATRSFYGVNPTAALLVAPTCVWVLVAASLNLDVWYLNSLRG